MCIRDRLMDEADKGEARHDYEVTMYGAADEIAPQLIKGDIDVALVPCNLAGVLYNKTGGAVEVAAVNTLGVLLSLIHISLPRRCARMASAPRSSVRRHF